MSEQKLEKPGEEVLVRVDVSEMIATRAYEIFQEHGGEHGHDLDDWLQAEREVLASPIGAEVGSSADEPQLVSKAAAATGVAGNEAQASGPSARRGKKK